MMWGVVGRFGLDCSAGVAMASDAINDVDVTYSAIHVHGLDDKRRLQIPSKWRLDGWPTIFFLAIWPDEKAGHHVRALPPEELRHLKGKLKSMSASNEKLNALRRLLGGRSELVTLDKAGRLCLPEWLVTDAGIEKEAVLVGAFDYFEIWSPERHTQAKASDELLEKEAYDLT